MLSKFWLGSLKKEITQRPSRRCKDNIKLNCMNTALKIVNYFYVAQHRDRWRAFVHTAINLGSTKGG
jgi:hypothetical protein